jgi:hypothetical protein
LKNELTNLRDFFICKNIPEDFICPFCEQCMCRLVKRRKLEAEAEAKAKAEEKTEEGAEVKAGLFKIQN